MQLTSSGFTHQSPIPAEYTCKGQNTNPPLQISGIPPATKSLALIMHDPDAPNGDFLHWTIWNIHPLTTAIAPNTIPEGAVQGLNDFGIVGYGGPCPHAGTHRYVFELYALNAMLEVPEGTARQELQAAIDAHLLEKTGLTGLFSATQ